MRRLFSSGVRCIRTVDYTCRSSIPIAVFQIELLANLALDGVGHVQSFNREKAMNLDEHHSTSLERQDHSYASKQAACVESSKMRMSCLFKFNTRNSCIMLKTVSNSEHTNFTHTIKNLETV